MHEKGESFVLLVKLPKQHKASDRHTPYPIPFGLGHDGNSYIVGTYGFSQNLPHSYYRVVDGRPVRIRMRRGNVSGFGGISQLKGGGCLSFSNYHHVVFRNGRFRLRPFSTFDASRRAAAVDYSRIFRGDSHHFRARTDYGSRLIISDAAGRSVKTYDIAATQLAHPCIAPDELTVGVVDVAGVNVYIFDLDS